MFNTELAERVPMFNTELAERVLAHIRAYPETWDQATWCGTACCFAGHATLLSGYHQVLPGGVFTAYVKKDGEKSEDRRYVPHLATELLGLSAEDADLLFRATNPLSLLEHLVKAGANGESMSEAYDQYVYEETLL